MVDVGDMMGSLDPSMVVVTACDGRERDGCLVGFSTQCSIDPARYLVCLSKANRTYELARSSSCLVVHVLRDDPRDRALAEHFGGRTEHDHADKLADVDWRPGPDGAPVLADCDWFAGRVIACHDLGDHVGFVLDVSDADGDGVDEPPLRFRAVQHVDAGNPA
jgi:flavin reductase (DIM6/NTAB) family NADH-FMN oxidoreductase RutF